MNVANPLSHENTSAIITGGSQGLGYAIAERLALEGARNIVIAGRDEQKGKKAAAQLSGMGTSCFFVPVNLEDIAQCNNLFSIAQNKCGTVNALVNAAADTSRGSLLDAMTQLLDKDRPGSIVNILSLAALCGQSYLTSYSSTKGALASMTKNVANSFATNKIRCNGVMTGALVEYDQFVMGAYPQ